MSVFEFGTDINPKDRASAGFLGQVHRAITSAFYREKKMTGLSQKQIAESIEIDRTAISRLLAGAGNPTIRTLAEICWGMGLRPELVLHRITQENTNELAGPESLFNSTTTHTSSLGSVRVIKHQEWQQAAETAT